LLRLVLGFVFFFFHALLYWVLTRALLGQTLQLELVQVLVVAILNAIVAVFLYQFLDRLRITG
jgi:Gpi18-like mannosyltransferase